MILTKTLPVLGARILAKLRQRTTVDLLVGGLHTKHRLSSSVSLLRQIVDDLVRKTVSQTPRFEAVIPEEIGSKRKQDTLKRQTYPEPERNVTKERNMRSPHCPR